MTNIAFTAEAFRTLKQLLASDSRETCVVLLANSVTIAGRTRLLIVEHHTAPEDAYTHRTGTTATLNPTFFIPLIKRARDEGLAVIFAHTHPGNASSSRFSSVDDAGEQQLGPFLKMRVPGLPHCGLVLSNNGHSARVMLTGEPVGISVVGSDVVSLTPLDEKEGLGALWDRQVRAFGPVGQRRLKSTRVGVIGCGGTGSVVLQQLTHLGVGEIVLVDPDVVELTNLNRVAGASLADVGRLKVDVAADAIARVGLQTSVVRIARNVLEEGTQSSLLNLDAIFLCTDSHGSRALLNQIAYQYYLPVFDVGVSITAQDQRVTHITGRVQMLAPGLGCLVCAQALDFVQVRQDLQTEQERRANPYISGTVEPQPAVISINSSMSGLAVTMFLAAFTGIPAAARLQYYDGIKGNVRSAAVRRQPGCVVCSPAGALGRGRAWPLPILSNTNA